MNRKLRQSSFGRQSGHGQQRYDLEESSGSTGFSFLKAGPRHTTRSQRTFLFEQVEAVVAFANLIDVFQVELGNVFAPASVESFDSVRTSARACLRWRGQEVGAGGTRRCGCKSFMRFSSVWSCSGLPRNSYQCGCRAGERKEAAKRQSERTSAILLAV